MPLYACSLNSGSNGNCYYIGTDQDAVLVDAGLSCKETERRMRECGLSMLKLRAIFISHEHIDHIRGIERIATKYQLPVYISAPTLQQSRVNIPASLQKNIADGEVVELHQMHIRSFKKYHDAADPHSFVISHQGISIGIFTDLGRVSKKLIQNFSMCHAAFLESNYDEEMLANGPYPSHLKKRISGGNGHLSNMQALQLFLKHRNKQLSHLFLSHLSNENNSPALVERLFNHHTSNTQIVIASRFNPTPVFEVSPGLMKNKKENIIPLRKGTQIQMF